MDKTLQNPALFTDGTDGLDVKTLNITNRSQLAVMRSAVRSRLSPPEKSWNLTISGLFLYFLPQIVSRIFAVMRLDPDLTQTGENAVDLLRFIWQNSTSFSVFKNILNVWTAAASCSRRFDFSSDRVSNGVSNRICRALFHAWRRVDIGAERESCAEVTQRFWKRPHYMKTIKK